MRRTRTPADCPRRAAFGRVRRSRSGGRGKALRAHRRIGLVLVLGLLVSAGARAQGGTGSVSDKPFDLVADSVEYDSARDVYTARGNVRINQSGRQLTADWVAYSGVTHQGIAVGHVVFTEKDDVLHADLIHFEADQLRGVIYDGHLDAGAKGFMATGDQIRRTDPDSYEAKDATLTTCRCPDEGKPPWAIHARDADLETGGYATTRNTTIDVLGVPVFWVPWLRFPVKSERETGLLLPEVHVSGRNGFSVGTPFFWAAADNVNVTLTPRYLAKNGVKPEADVEYVFGRDSSGEVFGSFVHDKSVDHNDPSTPFSADRWGAEWVHDQALPGGMRFKADARHFSDNLYPFDFNEFQNYRNDRYVESDAFVEGRFASLDSIGFTGAVQWANDIQNPNNGDRDQFVLQRLPDLRLRASPTPIEPLGGRVFFDFDTRYTHFWQRRSANEVYPNASVVGDSLFLDTGVDAQPDGFERNRAGHKVTYDAHSDDFPLGTENNGQFDEGEPIDDHGSRVVLNPHVQVPFTLFDRVEVQPEVGYHGTFYSTSNQTYADRHLATGLLDVRTRFVGETTLPFGLGPASHVLEPAVTWAGIGRLNGSDRDNPLLVPRAAVLQDRLRQLALENQLRDPSDRIESVNAVRGSLGNRFYGRDPGGVEGAPPWLFGDAVLSYLYDFDSHQRQNVYLDGSLYPLHTLYNRFSVGYSLDRGALAEALFQLGWSSPKGHDVSVSYRRVPKLPPYFEDFRYDNQRFDNSQTTFTEINQVDFFTRIALTSSWAITHNLTYSFEDQVVLNNQGGIEYISKCKCWALRVEIADNRSRGVDVGVRYRLLGIGDDSVRPFQSGRTRVTDTKLENPVGPSARKAEAEPEAPSDPSLASPGTL